MKILHVANSLAGGIGTCVMDLAARQQQLGHAIEIWHAREAACQRAGGAGAGLPGLRIREFPVFGPPAIGYSPVMEKALGREAGNTFDLLHYHGLWRATARIPAIWSRKHGKPIVYSIHGALQPVALQRSSWKKHLAAYVYQDSALQKASCIHVSSGNELASVRNYGLRNPAAIIANGIPRRDLSLHGDAERFRKAHDIPGDMRIMLSLSRIHPSKGYRHLLDACRLIAENLKGWMLIIAGTDELDYQKELRNQAKSYNITPHVRFVGPQMGMAKFDAFAAADMFVLPTLTENFGIVIAEALAAGLPVITTTGAPWKELVERNAGWWIAPESGPLAQALMAAMRLSKDDLHSMGERGRLLVEQRYLLEDIADQFMLLYAWLASGNQRPDFVQV